MHPPPPPPPPLVLSLSRLLELKRSGKLATVGIRELDKLERHLSDGEFTENFGGLDREGFYALPRWKRDKLKKDVGLF